MATTTIPGELFLLLTNDAGRQDSTQFRRQALAAAAVTELTLREKVELSTDRRPRVQVQDTASLGIPVLDQALGALTELDGKPLTSVISHRSMDLTEVIGESLVAAGAVQRRDGWFTTTWPAHDDTLERALRSRVALAVADPRDASLQDGILMELLRALGIAHRILRTDLPGLSRRELDQRIQALEIDHPAAAAMKRVVQDMTAAMMAAATAGGAAAAAGG
ncbi:GPP34 family phosphoprotein [Brachybacterium sp. YJGR34]|uniref:GOLPH3/VPS74 family protein n=1 Tax=Brachybacterium sp. YJGR34 TaxID=2059911 RepID=UPI000E0A08AF|nr:GPP34 family phosphoprotein [Brachybacterium sp. YJGR34]